MYSLNRSSSSNTNNNSNNPNLNPSSSSQLNPLDAPSTRSISIHSSPSPAHQNILSLSSTKNENSSLDQTDLMPQFQRFQIKAKSENCIQNNNYSLNNNNNLNNGKNAYNNNNNSYNNGYDSLTILSSPKDLNRTTSISSALASPAPFSSPYFSTGFSGSLISGIGNNGEFDDYNDNSVGDQPIESSEIPHRDSHGFPASPPPFIAQPSISVAESVSFRHSPSMSRIPSQYFDDHSDLIHPQLTNSSSSAALLSSLALAQSTNSLASASLLANSNSNNLPTSFPSLELSTSERNPIPAPAYSIHHINNHCNTTNNNNNNQSCDDANQSTTVPSSEFESLAFVLASSANLPPTDILRLQRQKKYYRQGTSPNPCPPTLMAMRQMMSMPMPMTVNGSSGRYA